MSKLSGWFGSRARGDGSTGHLMNIAREVVEHRRSINSAMGEVRHASVLDNLSDEDFRSLDEIIEDAADEQPVYAVVLARLTHAAARNKGFDRQVVDAALRLDLLLPRDDEKREREQLLRDAYTIAQRAGYVRGGRVALARLGEQALDAGDYDRARLLFQQQLDIADEQTDGVVEVDTAIQLGDILRQEGDPIVAQAYYRRASRSAQRIDYPRGGAEALVRQINLMDPNTSPETVAALQRQALDAAKRTADLGLQSRIVLSLAETLTRLGQVDEVIPQLETGVALARQMDDLAMEQRCLSALVAAERQSGDLEAIAGHEADLYVLEERLGNQEGAAQWAYRLGTTYLQLNDANAAGESFDRARLLANTLGDTDLEELALGGLGQSCILLGYEADAIDYLMQALDLARASRNSHHEARWLLSIGQALWQFEQPEDANRMLADALAIARRLDDSEMQITILLKVGQIQAATGQLPRAREAYSRAYDLARRLDMPAQECRLLQLLGGIAMESRQATHAIQLYQQALKRAEDIGDRQSAVRIHGKLGSIAQRQREPQGAINHFRMAVDLAETVNEPRLLVQALTHLATAMHTAGDAHAPAVYRRAIGLAHETGDTNAEALLQFNLGTLLLQGGHRDDGLDHMAQAATLARRLGVGGNTLLGQIEAAVEAAGARVTRRRAEESGPNFPYDRSSSGDPNLYGNDDDLPEDDSYPTR